MQLWVIWKECVLLSNINGLLYVFCTHTGWKKKLRFYRTKALTLKSSIPSFSPVFLLCVTSHTSSLCCFNFHFTKFKDKNSRSALYPHHVCLQFLKCSEVKLVMMYSACSLRLEIAAGYSGAASCRLFLNDPTVCRHATYCLPQHLISCTQTYRQ